MAETTNNCCLPAFAKNAPAGPTPSGTYYPEVRTKMEKQLSKIARVNHRIMARVPRRKKHRYF